MPLVYLDSNIYLSVGLEEKDSDYAKQLLGLIEEERVEAVSSVIALSEISGTISRRTADINAAIDFTKEVYTFPNLVFIPFTLPIAKESFLNAAKYKLRGMDAIHFTCARIAKVESFITLDKEFQQKVTDQIDVLTPKEFLIKL